MEQYGPNASMPHSQQQPGQFSQTTNRGPPTMMVASPSSTRRMPSNVRREAGLPTISLQSPSRNKSSLISVDGTSQHTWNNPQTSQHHTQSQQHPHQHQQYNTNSDNNNNPNSANSNQEPTQSYQPQRRHEDSGRYDGGSDYGAPSLHHEPHSHPHQFRQPAYPRAAGYQSHGPRPPPSPMTIRRKNNLQLVARSTSAPAEDDIVGTFSVDLSQQMERMKAMQERYQMQQQVIGQQEVTLAQHESTIGVMQSAEDELQREIQRLSELLRYDATAKEGLQEQVLRLRELLMQKDGEMSQLVALNTTTTEKVQSSHNEHIRTLQAEIEAAKLAAETMSKDAEAIKATLNESETLCKHQQQQLDTATTERAQVQSESEDNSTRLQNEIITLQQSLEEIKKENAQLIDQHDTDSSDHIKQVSQLTVDLAELTQTLADKDAAFETQLSQSKVLASAVELELVQKIASKDEDFSKKEMDLLQQIAVKSEECVKKEQELVKNAAELSATVAEKTTVLQQQEDLNTAHSVVIEEKDAKITELNEKEAAFVLQLEHSNETMTTVLEQHAETLLEHQTQLADKDVAILKHDEMVANMKQSMEELTSKLSELESKKINQPTTSVSEQDNTTHTSQTSHVASPTKLTGAGSNVDDDLSVFKQHLSSIVDNTIEIGGVATLDPLLATVLKRFNDVKEKLATAQDTASENVTLLKQVSVRDHELETLIEQIANLKVQLKTATGGVGSPGSDIETKTGTGTETTTTMKATVTSEDEVNTNESSMSSKSFSSSSLSSVVTTAFESTTATTATTWGLTSKLRDCEGEISQLKMKLKRAEWENTSKITDHVGEMKQVRQDLAAAHTALETNRAEMSDMAQKVTTLEQAEQDYELCCVDLNNELKQKQTRFEQLQHEADTARVNFEASLSEVHVVSDDLRATLEFTTKEHTLALEQMAPKENELAELTKKLQHIQESETTLTAALEEKKQECERLDADIKRHAILLQEHETHTQSSETELAEATKTNTILKEEVTTFKKRLSDVRGELDADLKDKVTTLESSEKAAVEAKLRAEETLRTTVQSLNKEITLLRNAREKQIKEMENLREKLSQLSGADELTKLLLQEKAGLMEMLERIQEDLEGKAADLEAKKAEAIELTMELEETKVQAREELTNKLQIQRKESQVQLNSLQSEVHTLKQRVGDLTEKLVDVQERLAEEQAKTAHLEQFIREAEDRESLAKETEARQATLFTLSLDTYQHTIQAVADLLQVELEPFERHLLEDPLNPSEDPEAGWRQHCTTHDDAIASSVVKLQQRLAEGPAAIQAERDHAAKEKATMQEQFDRQISRIKEKMDRKEAMLKNFDTELQQFETAKALAEKAETDLGDAHAELDRLKTKLSDQRTEINSLKAQLGEEIQLKDALLARVSNRPKKPTHPRRGEVLNLKDSLAKSNAAWKAKLVAKQKQFDALQTTLQEEQAKTTATYEKKLAARKERLSQYKTQNETLKTTLRTSQVLQQTLENEVEQYYRNSDE